MASSTNPSVLTATRIVALTVPTWFHHGISYTVEKVTNYGSGSPSRATYQVRPDKILDWVSLDELTRFEHQRCLNEQALEKTKLPRKRGRPPRSLPSAIQPFGLEEETETSPGESDEYASTAIVHTVKRPRGRPRKQPLRIGVRVPVEPKRSSLATGVSRKRRRLSPELPSDFETVNGEINRPSLATQTSIAIRIPRVTLGSIDHREISHDSDLADVSSDEDELGTLHQQFNATSCNRVHQSIQTTSQISICVPNGRRGSSSARLEHSFPSTGRAASIDLGASSDTEVSMRFSPVPVQSQPRQNSPHFAPGEDQAPDKSRSHRPTIDHDIIDLVSDEESGQDVNTDRSLANGKSTQWTFLSNPEAGSPDAGSASKRKRGRPSKHASPIRVTPLPQRQEHMSPHSAFRDLGLKMPISSPRPSNPFQRFARERQQPLGDDTLASMGAGETFLASTTIQQLQASNRDPTTQDNLYGQPLPLHPVTPSASLDNISHYSRRTNGDDTQSKTSSQRRERKSMTPLFPSAAIVPDLAAINGTPSKRREKILSTQQFQT